jgi:hypothetical protein
MKSAWQISEEARYLEIYADANVSNDGVARWKSNNAVPPADIVAVWAANDKYVDVAACDAARDVDTARFFAEYRAAQRRRTPEQIAEERAMARGAHGPGVELVNVLTGERYRT